MDFLDDIFSPFIWDKNFYNFTREEKDMHPYSVICHEDGSVTIVHNVLGLNKEDIKLVAKEMHGKGYILIAGKTVDEITKKTYSINSRFECNVQRCDLDKITSNMKNGLLYINIEAKENKPQEKKENIITIS